MIKTLRDLASFGLLAAALVAIMATSPARWNLHAVGAGTLQLAPGASEVTRGIEVSLPAAQGVSGHQLHFNISLSTAANASQARVEARVVEGSPASDTLVGASPLTLYTSRQCPAVGPCVARIELTLRRLGSRSELVSVPWSVVVNVTSSGTTVAPRGASVRVDMKP